MAYDNSTTKRSYPMSGMSGGSYGKSYSGSAPANRTHSVFGIYKGSMGRMNTSTPSGTKASGKKNDNYGASNGYD